MAPPPRPVIALRADIDALAMADGLREQAAAGAAQIVGRGLGQDPKLRPERGDEPADFVTNFLTLRPGGQNFPNYLRQLNQVGESWCAGRPIADGPVGELGDPMQHADRERLATLRARAFVLPARQPVPGTQGVGHREVIKLNIEGRGLATEHRR